MALETERGVSGGGGRYFLGVRASRGLYRHIVEQIASVTGYHSTIAPGSGSPGQVFTASTVTSRIIGVAYPAPAYPSLLAHKW